MMKLYELTGEYAQLLELLNDADADKEVLQNVLENVKGQIEEKAENIAKIIRCMESDIEAIKQEENRLQAKRQSLENKKTSIKNYLQQQLENAGMQKVKTPIFSIGIQNNPPSVNIIDENLIPDNFKIIKAEIDKKAIMQAIKEGKTVEGAELKQTQSLRIR